MKQNYIKDIMVDDVVTDFFMVKNVGLKIGSNKKQYLDITLGDNTGEVSAKKWDIQPEEISDLKEYSDGDLVKIRGRVTEWNGMKQVRITKIRMAMPNDNLIISNYVKAAPEDSIDMYNYIYGIAESLDDEDLKKLCLMILNREKDRLMYYPAATKNHHAIYGGLLYHVKRMVENGEGMCKVYKNLNRSLLLAGAILHDMQKLNEIEANEYGMGTDYSFEGKMLGHLVLGVRELEKDMIELDFPKEKSVMLEHMILSHHYEPEFGSPIRPLFPEAEILHYLDIIDARMYDMEEALQGATSGGFSDRVWTLDNRRIYKKED